MKGLILFFFCCVILSCLYFGYLFFVGKSVKKQPTIDRTQYSNDWRSQSQKAQDIMQQQRELMRQRQERMRDLGHR